MSVTIEVYLHADRLPTVKAWQEQIRREGFALDLEDDGSPLQGLSGCLPCTFNGAETGFELYLDRAEEELDTALSQAVADRQTVATFAFTGDRNALRAASVAAGVLAQMCDGVLYDPQADEVVMGTDAVANARAEVRQSEHWEAVDSTPEAKRLKTEREEGYRKKWWQFWR